MTSLHYTLIALGIALVGAVMLYNLYQERRSRKQAERIFRLPDDDQDVSLGDLPMPEDLPETRIEPRLSVLEEEETIVVTPPPETRVAEAPKPVVAPPPEPVSLPDEPVRPAAMVASGGHAMAPESPLDGEIEFVARLRYTQPTAVQFATLQENLRRISKPIRMVGQREDGEWEPVLGHAARPYETIELSILLADRAGPVSEVQLDAFCRRLYEFASEHGGAISCQDKAKAIEQAQALDAFCAKVDMLIGLNVLPTASDGFDHRTVRDMVVQAGMGQGADGIYSLKDENGQILFTLTDGAALQDEAMHGLTLLFDVPRVARGLESFDRMTEFGLLLAAELGGNLVDDSGRPVSRASLARDRKSLESIYAMMAERGIPAGGERALRLFA